MNMKLKWGTAGWLRRGAVILGAAALAASAGLLTAGAALAGVGTLPGDLELLQAGAVVTTGPLTTTTTWESTAACPAGYQTSAQMSEWTTGSTPTEISLISPVTSVGLASPDFTGSLDSTPGAILSSAGISATSPGTVEWVIGCYAGASGTGAVEYEASTFISVASGATNFTTSATGPVITATTTTLTYSPSTVTTTTTVTLTAAVIAADSTYQAGTVQFESNGTDIGSPVAVNTGSVSAPATTTTTFPTAGTYSVEAVYTPTNTTSYSGSSDTVSIPVEQAGSLPATGSPVPITVTIPTSGTLTVTVVNTTVPLTLNSAGTAATGTLGNVTVTDTRNSYPGWSVSGLESEFTEAAPGTGTIAGDQMGWVPGAVGTLGSGVTLGPTVAPGTSPGLGDTPQVLFSATPGNGYGTNVANAALTLDIPTGTPAGSYSGSMSVTYLSVGP